VPAAPAGPARVREKREPSRQTRTLSDRRRHALQGSSLTVAVLGDCRRRIAGDGGRATALRADLVAVELIAREKYREKHGTAHHDWMSSGRSHSLRGGLASEARNHRRALTFLYFPAGHSVLRSNHTREERMNELVGGLQFQDRTNSWQTIGLLRWAQCILRCSGTARPPKTQKQRGR
jgi:hypothetical protein